MKDAMVATRIGRDAAERAGSSTDICKKCREFGTAYLGNGICTDVTVVVERQDVSNHSKEYRIVIAACDDYQEETRTIADLEKEQGQ